MINGWNEEIKSVFFTSHIGCVKVNFGSIMREQLLLHAVNHPHFKLDPLPALVSSEAQTSNLIPGAMANSLKHF